MTRAWILPILGITLLVAVMLGVGLGNATVAGINPIHFETSQAPRLRPMVLDAAPTANLARRMPSYNQLYGWQEGQAALAEACAPYCGQAGSYSAAVPYFGSREEAEAREMRERREIDAGYADEILVSTRRAEPAVVEIAAPAPAPAVEPVRLEVAPVVDVLQE